jgi:hypothetical protein
MTLHRTAEPASNRSIVGPSVKEIERRKPPQDTVLTELGLATGWVEMHQYQSRARVLARTFDSTQVLSLDLTPTLDQVRDPRAWTKFQTF